jgi:hypothetical protein
MTDLTQCETEFFGRAIKISVLWSDMPITVNRIRADLP